MEFFKANTNIDFMSQRRWAAVFSCALFIFSVAALAINGLNFGLDFTGGTQLEITYKQVANPQQVREQLTAANFDDAVVQTYGTSRDVMVRLKPQKELTQQQLTNKVMQVLTGARLQSVEYIGPQVGRALVTNGVLAILVSMLATMIYIALRFEYRFAVSAAVALIHDPILILGIFAFFHLEFDLITLAALLTVLGYSLNDTIVVYDRVRENFRKIRKVELLDIMNISVNQTLSRTIMTSGLTLLVVGALCIFGGQMLRGFSLALIIGIVIGTYSSIYIAGSLAVVMGLDKKSLLPPERTDLDNLP